MTRCSCLRPNNGSLCPKGGKVGDKFRSAYYSHRNALGLLWTDFGESEPSRFSPLPLCWKSLTGQNIRVSETASLCLTICSPCLWCCLARNSMTNHTFLVQTASGTWSTHTETAVSLTRMLYPRIMCLSVGARLGQINDQHFNIWFGRERRYGRAGQGMPITPALAIY